MSEKSNSFLSFFNSNIRIASTQWSLRSTFILDIAIFLAQLSLVMALALAVGIPLFATIVVSVMIVPTLFQSIVLFGGILSEYFCSITSNECAIANQLSI